MDSTSQLRVLLVEDSALTAEQLRELIHTSSCPVDITTVTSERDAIAEFSRISPDIVVLDLKLHRGTGFGVLQEIASTTPKPGLVVLTNYALPKYKELALSTGADYFLDKSFDFKTLPGVIELLASRRGQSDN